MSSAITLRYLPQVERAQIASNHPAPSYASLPGFTLVQAKLRQKRRKETHLELERVRALEEKAEVRRL